MESLKSVSFSKSGVFHTAKQFFLEFIKNEPIQKKAPPTPNNVYLSVVLLCQMCLEILVRPDFITRLQF